MFEYFIVMFCFLVAAGLLHRVYHLKLYKSRAQAWFSTITYAVVGTILDYYGTYRSLWTFTPDGKIGVEVYGLPVEEFAFFLVMPYFLLVLYKLIEKKFQ